MKALILLLALLVQPAPVLLHASTGGSSAVPDGELIDLLRGRGEAVSWTDEDLAEAYGRALQILLRELTAADPTTRGGARTELEGIVAHATRPGADHQLELLGRVMAGATSPVIPRDARSFLVRQLGSCRDAATIALLGRLLDDKDPTIVDEARRALERIGTADATTTLRGCLGTRTAEGDTIAIIQSLGALRDHAAVEAIRALLDTSPAVAEAGIIALSRIGGRDARTVLRARFESGSRSAGHALLRLLETELDGDTISALYEHADTDALRYGALRLLCQQDPASGFRELLAIARGQASPGLKQSITPLIADLPGNTYSQAWLRELPNIPRDVQPAVIAALGRRGDASLIPALLAELNTTDAVGVAALGAIVELERATGAPGLVVPLSTIASTRSPLAGPARDAVIGLRGPGVDGELTAALSSATPNVVAECIRILAERRSSGARDAILPLTRSEQEIVRAASFRGLTDLSRPEDLSDLLERFISETSGSVRHAARDLLAATARRVESRPRWAPIHTRWLNTDPANRAAFAELLGMVQEPESLPLLEAAVKGDAPELRDAAIRSLARWETPEPLDTLHRIAKESEVVAHRVLALGGYLRLLAESSSAPADKIARFEQALELAERDQERRLVLSLIASIPCRAALDLTDRLLDSKGLATEAALAQAKLVRALAPGDPEDARARLTRILALPVKESAHVEARAVLDELDRTRSFIGNWNYAGPYFEKDLDVAQVFAKTFPPEAKANGNARIEWRALPEMNPYQLDLTAIDGGSTRAIYLRTTLVVPTARKVRFALGSDDGVKVWVGSRLVHANEVYRPLAPGDDQVEVELAAGENPVLVKVVQGAGGWGFCLQVTDTEGRPMNDLTTRQPR